METSEVFFCLEKSMLFTVFGYPISHSLSPMIHQDFAQQFSLTLNYSKTLSKPEEFLEKLTQFKNNGGSGANVTAPLKQEAFSLCEQFTARAQSAKSVNTVYWEKNKLVGDNTDGVGFERDIYVNAQQCFEDQNILLLGAGGAALGILPIIIQHKPRSIYLFNRTLNHINHIKKICDKSAQIKVVQQDLDTPCFHWVINTAGQFDLFNLLDNLMYTEEKFKGAKFYDLSYAQSGLTNFLKNSKKYIPAWSSDGFGMLVEQAAESFYVWHEKKPETRALLKNKVVKPER